MQTVPRIRPLLQKLRFALLKAVYGIPNARGNELADLFGPGVAAMPSCAATPVVAQWSPCRREVG